jgi:hypothetical protein
MIDYSILHNALGTYETSSAPFKRIEVPWVVSKEISDLTRPTWVHAHDVVKNGRVKTFVGSGEQGFLYLWAKEYLTPGQYVTCTPCLRDDAFDETHVKYFMKVELFKNDSLRPEIDAESMMYIAKRFFSKYVNPKDIEEVKTDEGWDLNFHGIEIGSYGVRECMMGTWVYGTGVAEPRFSRLINKFGTGK